MNFYDFLTFFCLYFYCVCISMRPVRGQWRYFRRLRMLCARFSGERLVILLREDIPHFQELPYMGDISWSKCVNCVQIPHSSRTVFASFLVILAGRCAYCVHIPRKVSIGDHGYPSSVVSRCKCESCDPFHRSGNRCFPWTSLLCINLWVPSRCSYKKRSLREDLTSP